MRKRSPNFAMVSGSDPAVLASGMSSLAATSSSSHGSLQAGCAQAQADLQHNRLAQAWAVLASLTEVYGEHYEVRSLQGGVLFAAGQYAQAFAYFQASLALAPHNGQTLASAGGCLHLLGRLPEALQHYRSALQAQCARPIRLIEPPPPPPFDNAAAEKRLWEVLTQLARAGVHAFATAGTLLGLEREGRLLPFDKDLDVGLPFAEMQAATNVLLQSGWLRAKAPQGMINPIMLHDGNGLALDLCGFVAEVDTGSALGGFWLRGVPKEWQRVTQFPILHLQQQPCPTGRRVWAVSNPHAWLAALYGPDWRVPDPDFDTVVAASNLRGFALLTQCYALSRIYGRWLEGRVQKAAALTREALRHAPDDALLLQVQESLAMQQAAQTQSQTKKLEPICTSA